MIAIMFNCKFIKLNKIIYELVFFSKKKGNRIFALILPYRNELVGTLSSLIVEHFPLAKIFRNFVVI